MIDVGNEDAGPAASGTVEEWFGRVVVIAVSGDLDMVTAPRLNVAIDAAIRKDPQALVVDLSAVDFLASAGMGVLIAASQRLANSTGFGVVAHGPATSRPLMLLGIDSLLDVFDTLDEALTSVTTPATRR
ncbi:STAS domain-containing protein [Mycolicibacterium sediminis]|uniref:Anti-sigma factor antagonist n=1 Tax=Mycolicibacterium sediminis TaxID=1286180 RepID=A0A7I7QVJ9_9MYCO|nr:STAS domain-containing protein [Mycolicibacterium sediminis]BBY30373.1 anti-sigma factor antagonist [Mycolicibacterium sediminis]